MPAQEHGLYEWNILEPALGEVICPLSFNLAGSDVPEGLGTLSRTLQAVDGPAYAFIYWDEIDRVGHEYGPSSPQSTRRPARRSMRCRSGWRSCAA